MLGNCVYPLFEPKSFSLSINSSSSSKFVLFICITSLPFSSLAFVYTDTLSVPVTIAFASFGLSTLIISLLLTFAPISSKFTPDNTVLLLSFFSKYKL